MKAHTSHDRLYHMSNKYTNSSKEFKILKQIKTKLIENNALITKADIGKTLVIMDSESYTMKVNDFISNNNIITLKFDPTHI